MKLALAVAVYDRHDLEQIVLDRFRRQAAKFGFEIIVAGSEGAASKRLAEGCHYVEFPNTPVSDKHNAITLKAKELDVDGVVVFGSDDLVNDRYWEFIQQFKADEKNIIGIMDLYFYATGSKTMGRWPGYRNKTQTAGAGRFYSRLILEQLGWKLWRKGINQGLDSSVNQRYPHEKAYTMAETGVFLVDVKHTRSVSGKGLIKSCEPVEKEIMLEPLGAEDYEKIIALTDRPEEIEDTREFKKGEIVKFYSNGKYRPLGERVIEMTVESARILRGKGFGKF